MQSNDFEITSDYLVIRDKQTILKLRSLGAGVEEESIAKVSLLEAAYFADRGVIPVSKDELLKKSNLNDPLSHEKYSVIKYLRNLGYIVRPSLDGSPFLRLHRKGFRPGEDKTQYLIYVLKTSLNIDFESLSSYIDTSGKLRKELVLAFVDPKYEKPYFVKAGRMTID